MYERTHFLVSVLPSSYVLPSHTCNHKAAPHTSSPYNNHRYPVSAQRNNASIPDSAWVKSIWGNNIKHGVVGHVPGWAGWASLQTDLTEEEKELAHGPTLTLQLYNKADLGGVRLGCKYIEANKKAINSIIMAKRDTGSAVGDAKCGGISVGRILSFISHVAPGSREDELIADVEWFDTPAGNQHFNRELKCPVVKRAVRRDAGGDFYPLSAISPTKLMLVPHIPHNNELWQVLHTDSDFIVRYMPPAP